MKLRQTDVFPFCHRFTAYGTDNLIRAVRFDHGLLDAVIPYVAEQNGQPCFVPALGRQQM